MCRTVYHFVDKMMDIKCDHRKAITKPDSCVEFRSVQMSCPAGNLIEGRAVFLEDGAYPRIHCRVCGIGHLPEDSDSRTGFWRGKVTWGPNQFNNVLTEAEIKAYKLYVVDSQFQKLGEPLATQEVRLWATLRKTCCDTSTYEAHLDFELPQNSSFFMVVPVTLAGLELNVGPTSERIRDRKGMVTQTAAARRYWTALGLPVLLFALLPLLQFS